MESSEEGGCSTLKAMVGEWPGNGLAKMLPPPVRLYVRFLFKKRIACVVYDIYYPGRCMCVVWRRYYLMV